MNNYIARLKENFSCPPLGFFIGLGIGFVAVPSIEFMRLPLWFSIPAILIGVVSVSFPFWAHLCFKVRT